MANRWLFQASYTSSLHPNISIMAFALGFTLPALAAQLVCALFTEMVELDQAGWLFRTLLTTYDANQTGHCTEESQPQNPGGSLAAGPYPGPAASDIQQQVVPVPGPSANCAFCTFPLLSTLISAGCALCFLLVAWRVTERIVASVISKALVSRIRTLQLLVAVLLPASLLCRGMTVLFRPFDVGFELLRLGNVSRSCSPGSLLLSFGAQLCLDGL
jgi:hypothetical protein